MRKHGIRVGLVALLIVLAAAPIGYQYLASRTGIRTSAPVNSIDFGAAREVGISPSVLLGYTSVALNSVQEGNYTEARKSLAAIGRLPANIEHNLVTYVTLLQDLVSTLDSAKSSLDELRKMIGDGDISSARQKIQQLEGLLADASSRLNLLFSSLERIREIYGIDTSHQREDLQALSRILEGYEHALTEVKMTLDYVDARAVTSLELSVSPNPVWVDGALQVAGRLESGGVPLGIRIVEVWINGLLAAEPTLDGEGRFEWHYDVSNSSGAERLEIYAHYQPVGNDLSVYRPTRSTTVIVSVRYYPVVLALFPPANRLHVSETFTVLGTLTNASGTPLPGRVLELLVDDKLEDTVVTNENGAYSIITSFPPGTSPGGHQFYVRFAPKQGVYSSANSTKVVVELYYLQSTISLLNLSGAGLIGQSIIAVSGQPLALSGRAEVDSKPFMQGLLVVSLGGRELGRALSEADGSFSMIINAPLDATGENSLTITLVPGRPWIIGSAVSIPLNIVNVAMIGLAVGLFAVVGLLVSGRSRERHPARAVSLRRRETAAVGTEELRVEKLAVSSFPILRVSELRRLEPRSCVRETYWEARRILGEALHETGRLSETHREFCSRVVGRLGDAASPFAGLTRLFELAEYSERPSSRMEAEEAINYAIVVADTTGVEIKA